MRAPPLLKEPLIHFVLIGAVLFLVGRVADDGSSAVGNRIVVTQGVVQQMIATFTRTWQRPPTEGEVVGLVDDYIREQVYVREALALGLDRDDAIIRRRLRQKMEFLSEDVSNAVEPTEEELRAYLREHTAAYAVEPRLSFAQVYVSRDRRGRAAQADAQALLARLATAGPAAAASEGDASLLPVEMESAPPSEIQRAFGAQFADQLAGLEPGRWHSPLESDYGLHLIYIRDRAQGRMPDLNEVAPLVRRDLMARRRRELNDAVHQRLRDRYTVVIEDLAEAPRAGRRPAGSSGNGAP